MIPKNGKPIDTKTLVEGVYVNPPRRARQSVLVTVNNLMKKVDEYNEPFIIRKSDQRGPYPSELWREERKQKQKRQKQHS